METPFKPGSHTLPMIGESLSVNIQGANSQRILLTSNHRQRTSPMSATYENQALSLAWFSFVDDSLSVIIQGENFQRILLMSSH